MQMYLRHKWVYDNCSKSSWYNPVIFVFSNTLTFAEAYSEHFQTSKMELMVFIVKKKIYYDD